MISYIPPINEKRVNPWTKSFARMRASDLVLVNHAGEVVDGNRAV